jgi:formylglycine-generating enzyme required for sulfatase activity
MPLGQDYYLLINNVPHGPYTAEQIQDWIKSQSIQADLNSVSFAIAGSSNWQPISSFSVAPVLPVAPSPSVPDKIVFKLSNIRIRPNLTLAALVFLSLVVISAGLVLVSGKREIEGQIFVVNQESENLKLRLVPIWVLGNSEMKKLAKQAVELADAVYLNAEKEKILKAIDEAENKAEQQFGNEGAQKVKIAAIGERNSVSKLLAASGALVERGNKLLEKLNEQQGRPNDGLAFNKTMSKSELVLRMLICLITEKELDVESGGDGQFKVSTAKSGGWLIAYANVGKMKSGTLSHFERYYWAVEFSQKKTQFILSNHNSNISEAETALRVLASRGTGVFDVLGDNFTAVGATQLIYARERNAKALTDGEEAKMRNAKALAEGKLLLDEAGRSLPLVPGGSFQMGSNEYADEKPVRQVSVAAFFMGETEVTFGEWVSVLGWAKANGYAFSNKGSGASDKHPVTDVSWHDTVKWCNAKSEKEGLTPCYRDSGGIYRSGTEDGVTCDWGTNGYRLPTEAEWEKAARGGLVGKKFPNGDSLEKTDANIDGSSTVEVGKYPANGYGLRDMEGNVREWCWDWYGTPYAGGIDPRGAGTGSNRVLRGGDWDYGANFARSARRGNSAPSNAYDSYGFRLARGRL